MGGKQFIQKCTLAVTDYTTVMFNRLIKHLVLLQHGHSNISAEKITKSSDHRNLDQGRDRECRTMIEEIQTYAFPATSLSMRSAASSTVAIVWALDSSTLISKCSSRPITISTCDEFGRTFSKILKEKIPKEQAIRLTN